MVSVIIADDHPVVRSGIVSILNEDDGIVVEAEAEDAEELFEICKKVCPDVVITDVNMAGPGIINTIKKLKTICPDSHVLVLSIHDPVDYALVTLKAGASGYISKHESGEHLIKAVQEVSKGNLYLTGKAAEIVYGALSQNGAERVNQFSGRELEVITMLGDGLSFKNIASKLGISPKTVSTYRTRLMEKLDLDSTNALIRYAHEQHSSLKETSEVKEE